jgi:hypothetical protein
MAMKKTVLVPFVALTAMVAIFWFLFPSGYSAGDALDAAQAEVQPVVQALDAHYSRHKAYPGSLQELVDAGLLTVVPRAPEEARSLDTRPLRYYVGPDRSFYFLKFAYDSPGIPGALICRYYISFEGQWETSKYPPSMDWLVAQRMGLKYQETKSFDDLIIAMAHLVKSSTLGDSCVNLWRQQINKCLGDGVGTPIPDSVEDGDATGYMFPSTGVESSGYCVTYMQKTMVGVDPDQTYTVVDTIFLVVRGDGAGDWEVYRVCR